MNLICGIYQNRLLTLTSCSVPARRSWFRVPNDLSFNISSVFFSQASRSFIVLCTLCYNQSNEHITSNYANAFIWASSSKSGWRDFFFFSEREVNYAKFISLRKNVFGGNRLFKQKRSNVNWANITFEEFRKKVIFANSQQNAFDLWWLPFTTAIKWALKTGKWKWEIFISLLSCVYRWRQMRR